MRDVILVCGPPCSGKSTLAAEMADGHEIVDYDAIAGGHHQFSDEAEAEVRRRINRIATTPDARAIVIRTCPEGWKREALAGTLGATRVLVMATDQRECRARADGRPSGTSRAIGLWFWRFTPASCDEWTW